MSINFCPYCGEDVQMRAEAAAAPAPEAAPRKEVIRREVTTAEKDKLWGLLQLPSRLVPIGVLVDAAKTPLALVLEDEEKRLWVGANGEVKMLGDLGIPDMPEAPPAPPAASHPATVPSHLCNSHGAKDSHERGQNRYGSRE